MTKNVLLLQYAEQAEPSSFINCIERARANSKTQHVNSRSAKVLLLPNHKKK